MTSTTLREPVIVAQSYRMNGVGPDAFRLTVDWRFANLAEAHIYVLLAIPIVTIASDPLILDHTEPSDERVNPNQSKGFRFLQLAPGASRVETLAYGVGLGQRLQITVIGRFGFNYLAPDPRWEEQRNWGQLEAWLHSIDSAPFTITRPLPSDDASLLV